MAIQPFIDQITGKVCQKQIETDVEKDVTTLQERMTAAEGAISEHATTIAAKADATDVTALAERVFDAETSLESKAAAADLTALAGRVTNAENAIGTKAAAADVTALGGRVTNAETAIVKKVDGGTGNVLGGYSVPATAYNATTHVLTLSNTADMTKFHIGESVTVNDLPEDTEEYGAEVWGEYRTAVISVVDADHFTLTLDSDLGLKTSGSLTNIVVRVLDSSRKDASFSSGDRNFVTGDAAGADGLMNTVTGTGAHAGGYGNYVSGDFSDARGVSNVITGNQSFATGGGNKVSGDMSNVAGLGNDVVGQSAQIIGNGNRNITGVDARILGDGNKASGTRAKIVGNQNDVSGDDSTAIGNGIQNAAKKAVVIGQRGELADLPENKGAVAIAGGDTGDGSKAISFIHRARKQDPLDPAETLPAFAHEFLGRLAAIPLRIADVGNIELDHDMYSRWVLTGTGAVTFTLANWIDGDRGEVVIDTSKQTFTIPAAWIVPDDVWDAWAESPGIYCMEIRQEGGAVYAHSLVPFNENENIGDHNTSNTAHFGILAPLASPAFTGTPTAPTAAAGTNNTQIATTAFVNNFASTFLSGDVKNAIQSNKWDRLAKSYASTDPSYIKLANGLLIQWGRVTCSGTSMTVSLSSPYASAGAYKVFATAAGSDKLSYGAYPSSASAFTLYTSANTTYQCSWLAIGHWD